MMIVDIETTGLNPVKNSIIEIAAIKFDKPDVYFHSLCRIDKEDEIDPKALEINGQSLKEIRDVNRPSQKQALIDFFKWINKQQDFFIGGQNVGEFDWNFLRAKAEKYGLDFPLHKRTLDLHAVTFFKYLKVHNKFFVDKGISSMGLPAILQFLGLRDERGKHNALEDTKLEAECFSRLLNGKNLLEEFKQFSIPHYLKND